jgi:beta-fructofuranosidase
MEHGQKITSWRDPYIAAWPEMDDHLGYPHGRFLYGVVSGGLRDKTPTAFMYRIEKNDMTRWSYVSTLANVGYHHRTHELSPEMGRNWEVCNFFTLAGKQYILMNVEGVGADLKQRYPMWAQVVLDKTTNTGASCPSVNLIPCKSGSVDHGCMYAATTSFHLPSARRLLWGWVPEADLAEERYDRQGWSGCIALPREIFQQTHKSISARSASDPLVLSLFEITKDASGATSALVPGIRPAGEMIGLRSDAVHLQTRSPSVSLIGYTPTSIRSRNFEATLKFRITSMSGLDVGDEIGMIVATNRQKTQGTKIVYRDNAVHIVRAFSSSDKDVNRDGIVAPTPLLQYADGSFEDVEMRVFLDNSVLEVFVNERTAVTTRIYCDDNAVDMVHLVCRTDSRKQQDDELFATASSSRACTRASLQSFDTWIGLQHAMLSDPSGQGAFKSLDAIVAGEPSTDSRL